MRELIKALEEMEQDFYRRSDTCGPATASKHIFITKGNIVADCIQLIKDHAEGQILVSERQLESIADNLACIGNYGPKAILNTQEMCMKMAEDISDMITKESNDE